MSIGYLKSNNEYKEIYYVFYKALYMYIGQFLGYLINNNAAKMWQQEERSI
jgi:hypothetical protein